jgi:hypothetical protein
MVPAFLSAMSRLKPSISFASKMSRCDAFHAKFSARTPSANPRAARGATEQGGGQRGLCSVFN